jgi:hypothetical protein
MFPFCRAVAVGGLPAGADFSLPCHGLGFGDAIALKPFECIKLAVSRGRTPGAFLLESVVNDATQSGGFRNTPAFCKPLEIPCCFGIQTVGCLDGCYGHTFCMIPFLNSESRDGNHSGFRYSGFFSAPLRDKIPELVSKKSEIFLSRFCVECGTGLSKLIRMLPSIRTLRAHFQLVYPIGSRSMVFFRFLTSLRFVLAGNLSGGLTRDARFLHPLQIAFV